MTASNSMSLPPEFSDLEAYAARWALPTTDARERQRQTAAMSEITAFYTAMQPRLPAIFDYLDRFDVAALPATAETLLNLAFGFIEAALAVEIFKQPGITGMPYPHGFSITRELRSRQR